MRDGGGRVPLKEEDGGDHWRGQGGPRRSRRIMSTLKEEDESDLAPKLE